MTAAPRERVHAHVAILLVSSALTFCTALLAILLSVGSKPLVEQPLNLSAVANDSEADVRFLSTFQTLYLAPVANTPNQTKTW